MTKFVAYLRVSTQKQGRSGLGLEAQREAVKRLVAERGGNIIAPEYVEQESGKRDDRPELAKAMKRCRATGATLVVAKLDRLSRNVAFLMQLRDSGIEFVAADLPTLNTMTIAVMAGVAQHERELISQRTKDALQAARARGKRLGGLRKGAANIRRHQKAGTEAAQEAALRWAEDRREMFEALKGEGLSLAKMAERLTEDGIRTRRGGSRWTPTQVHRVMEILGR